MTGFEDRVRSGLGQAAEEYEPSPHLRREVDRRVRRHRRGRIATGVVGAVGALLFVAGLGVLLATDDEGNQNESTAATTLPGGWSEVEVLGLTMEVPGAWWQQEFGPQCRIGYTGLLMGNVAADFEFESPSQGGCTTEWEDEGLPAGRVVVEVSRSDGGPTDEAPMGADTVFPLDAEVIPGVTGVSDLVPVVPVVLDGAEVARLSLWVGSDATDADLAIAHRIIESIRPT